MGKAVLFLVLALGMSLLCWYKPGPYDVLFLSLAWFNVGTATEAALR